MLDVVQNDVFEPHLLLHEEELLADT